jgi:hypothetical protein
MVKSLRFLGCLLTAGLLSTYSARAQNGSLAINTDGSQADASALLDVKSTTQGMLVPRMSAQQRGLIDKPATGLLVYQTDGTAGFYFYTGLAWTALNTAGATGPQGPAGATGPQGPKGDRGDAGVSGTTGPQGIQGPKGDKGDAGAIGGMGLQGPQGVKGDIGSQGLQGVAGPKGDKGDMGVAGTTGVQGPAGPTGTKGDKGDIGVTGAQGAAGAMGPQGPIGATGLQGPQGVVGPGVPAGGTAGQVLTKVNSTDYNTQWATPSSGGSGNSSGTSLQLSATLAATVTLPVSSSLTTPDVIPFDNVTTLPTLGNTWTGNNKFTVGANGAGTYLINVQVIGDNSAGAIPMIDMNGTGNSGSGYYGLFYGGSQTLQNPYKFRGHVSTVVKMASGDSFQIRAASSTTVYGPTLNTNGSTNISVVKLN